MQPTTRFKPDIDAAYRQHADMLYRVALAQLGNDADAQDAVQDVFIRYMSHTSVPESAEHEKAWLLRTAINRCHDIARRRKIREFLPLEDAHGIAVGQSSLAEVAEQLRALPAKLREAAILHHLEGFTLEETARILGIGLSAAKMRISRANDILKSALKEDVHV
ncbi:MAG: RNA polymerase sigma factor [Clostridia bacterium]|nr:RNA polymerase sigma factor [Clostridia bacterium]